MFYVVENGDEVFVASELNGFDVQTWIDQQSTLMTIVGMRLTEAEALTAAEEYCE